MIEAIIEKLILMKLHPIFRTSSRSDNRIFLTRHHGGLERMSPVFKAISVKMAG